MSGPANTRDAGQIKGRRWKGARSETSLQSEILLGSRKDKMGHAKDTQQGAPMNYHSNQTFTDIKDKLKDKNTLFEDDVFDKTVLRKNQDQNQELLEKVQWMRPPDICKHFGLDPPQFQVNGISR